MISGADAAGGDDIDAILNEINLEANKKSGTGDNQHPAEQNVKKGKKKGTLSIEYRPSTAVEFQVVSASRLKTM